MRRNVIQVLIVYRMSVRELNKHIDTGRIRKAALKDMDKLREDIQRVREWEEEEALKERMAAITAQMFG